MLKFNQVSVRVKHKKGKDRKTRMPGRVFVNGNIVFQDFIPGKDIVRILHVDRQAYALRPGKKRAAIAVLTESPVSISCIKDEKGIALLLDHRQSEHITIKMDRPRDIGARKKDDGAWCPHGQPLFRMVFIFCLCHGQLPLTFPESSRMPAWMRHGIRINVLCFSIR